MADLAYVMSQSLTPTKLDSSNPISPSKYPDRKSMVNAYKRMVNEIKLLASYTMKEQGTEWYFNAAFINAQTVVCMWVAPKHSTK